MKNTHYAVEDASVFRSRTVQELAPLKDPELKVIQRSCVHTHTRLIRSAVLNGSYQRIDGVRQYAGKQKRLLGASISGSRSFSLRTVGAVQARFRNSDNRSPNEHRLMRWRK